MFIRTVTVKGRSYVRLVESYRENGKVRQRYIGTICSQETWNMNGPEPFVEVVADYLRDKTDFGDKVWGTQKQVARVIENTAEDLLDDYERRLKAREENRRVPG